jgi:NitT/TauT family transport system substrate-binding protein
MAEKVFASWPGSSRCGRLITMLLAAAFSLPLLSAPGFAEVSEMRIAYQHSMAFLVVDVLLAKHMIEARAKESGLGDIKVSAVRFTSGPAANEALLKGDIEVGGAGLTPFLDLWQRTRGKENVRGVAPINDSPLFLITTDPHVKSIRDIVASDEVAVPASGSIQGLFLRMLADREFGKPDHLDANMVSMTSPEALKALTASGGGIRNYVASIPFDSAAMQLPGARELESSYTTMGGAHTLVLLFVTEKFRNENPKAYAALVSAIDDAMALIKASPKEAAEIFSAASQGETAPERVMEILARPDVGYSPVPHGTMKFATFMNKVGLLKTMPADWKEVYWDNAHGRDGS